MSWGQHNDLTKALAAIGLADASAAKLLAGALTNAASTASGTTQSEVYTLSSVSLPANFLNLANKGLLIFAFGTTAANANAKDLAVKVGGVTVASVTGSTANAKDFLFAALVLRTGVDTQVVYRLLIVDGAFVTAACGIGTTAIDESAANAIILTGANTAAAAASATGKGLSVILLG